MTDDWGAERLPKQTSDWSRRRARRRAVRDELSAARTYGLAARHAEKLTRGETPMTTPLRRCHVIDARRMQCTAEALDPNGEILICSTHGAQVLRLLDTIPITRRPA